MFSINNPILIRVWLNLYIFKNLHRDTQILCFMLIRLLLIGQYRYFVFFSANEFMFFVVFNMC